jgi:hypothetical protein
MSKRDDFDWRDDVIVQPERLAIAVYPNSDGDIVIRRRPYDYRETGDVWIIVGREHARRVAAAILSSVDEVEADIRADLDGGGGLIEVQPPKPARREALCKHCNQPFEASRSSAQYCSSTCRQAAHRASASHANSHANGDTDAALSVTEKKEEFVV